MQLRTPYNYDRNQVSIQTGLSCPEPTRTQQQFRDECDINQIVERFNITGVVPITTRTPLYGDYTGTVNDYQSALDLVHQAQTNFNQLPSKVRERFLNDPQQLLRFLGDTRNKAEAIELGLIEPPPEPPPAT